jgi:hypothetical protein
VEVPLHRRPEAPLQDRVKDRPDFAAVSPVAEGSHVPKPILATGMARSGGSWLAKMLVAGGGCVHINEPLNRRHPPGLSPGILDVPAPCAYQHIDAANEAAYVGGFEDMLRLRYRLWAELRANRSPYDLAKTVKYATAFSVGRARGARPVVDDPYAVFAAEWLADRFGCRVVFLVRHPAGIVSSMERIGSGWRDNLPDIAAQPALIRTYLGDFADDIQRVLAAPFDVLEHSCLLYRLLHAAIAQQASRLADAIVVRYEDLAADPLLGFERLYRQLGLRFTERAKTAIAAGSLAGAARRQSPWGRVRLSRTAFQPMDSRANAWLWRARLSPREIDTIVERTHDVASRFYSDAELAGQADQTAWAR